MKNIAEKNAHLIENYYICYASYKKTLQQYFISTVDNLKKLNSLSNKALNLLLYIKGRADTFSFDYRGEVVSTGKLHGDICFYVAGEEKFLNFYYRCFKNRTGVHAEVNDLMLELLNKNIIYFFVCSDALITIINPKFLSPVSLDGLYSTQELERRVNIELKSIRHYSEQMKTCNANIKRTILKDKNSTNWLKNIEPLTQKNIYDLEEIKNFTTINEKLIAIDEALDKEIDVIKEFIVNKKDAEERVDYLQEQIEDIESKVLDLREYKNAVLKEKQKLDKLEEQKKVEEKAKLLESLTYDEKLEFKNNLPEDVRSWYSRVVLSINQVFSHLEKNKVKFKDQQDKKYMLFLAINMFNGSGDKENIDLLEAYRAIKSKYDDLDVAHIINSSFSSKEIYFYTKEKIGSYFEPLVDKFKEIENEITAILPPKIRVT
jgi:hypothetical protein